MSGDAFSLTSHDVRAQEFQRALRGFDATQVEDFKERIAQELDRMVRERVQLDERLKSMVEQLKTFRDRERAMNEALIAAQQLRAEAQTQADREADLTLQRAQAQADKVLYEAQSAAQRTVEAAKGEEQRLHNVNEAVRRQFLGYVAAYRALLDRQRGELEATTAAMTPGHRSDQEAHDQPA
ncbi:MAG: DivIVA domain-containing protein [Gemmatimonadota bacterium]